MSPKAIHAAMGLIGLTSCTIPSTVANDKDVRVPAITEADMKLAPPREEVSVEATFIPSDGPVVANERSESGPDVKLATPMPR